MESGFRGFSRGVSLYTSRSHRIGVLVGGLFLPDSPALVPHPQDWAEGSSVSRVAFPRCS